MHDGNGVVSGIVPTYQMARGGSGEPFLLSEGAGSKQGPCQEGIGMDGIKAFGRKVRQELDERVSRVPAQVGYPSDKWEEVMGRCDGDALMVAGCIDMRSYWRDAFVR